MNLNPFSGGGSDDSSSDDSGSSSSNDSDGGGGFWGGVSDTVDDAVSGAQDTADDAVDSVTGGGGSSDSSSSNDSGGGGGVVDDARDFVDDSVDRAQNTVDGARETASNTVKNARDTVDNTIDRAQDTVDDARETASNTVNDAQDTVDNTVDRAQDTVDDAQDTVDNTVDRAQDTVDQTGDRARNVADDVTEGASDTANDVANSNVNTDVTDDLTRDGVLSETRDSNDGLVPGEVAGVELSEQGFRQAGERVDSVKDSFDENPDATVGGSDVPERILQGAAGASVDLLNVPSHIAMAETGVEVASNSPGAVQEYGAGEVAETATGVGVLAGSAIANEARSNPVEFGAGLGMDVVTGAGIAKAGKEVGKAAGRAGKTRVDAGDVTNRDTLDYYEGGDANPEDQFPGFRPDDYPEASGDPVETFRRQGEDFTPDEVKGDLGETSDTETYATHGTNYDFDSEFESGIEKSRPSDPDDAMFVGPEFSPNFAGFGGGGSGFSSLRPRLPRISDFRGGDKQMVVSKMDVDKVPEDVGPEARTGDSPMAPGDESQFLADEAEQGRAFVRNAENRNMGEAEALVPGGSTFRELSGSGNYYAEIDGETVDIRLFESADANPMSSPDTDVDAGTVDGPFDETGGFYTASELPSSGSTSPEGTPIVPTFGGYGGAPGGAPGAGGPMNVDESDLTEQSPPSDASGPANDPFSGFGDPGYGSGRSPGADGPSSSTSPGGDSGGPSSPPSSGGGPSIGFDETGITSGSGSTGSPGSSGPTSPGSPNSPGFAGSPTSPPGSGTPPSSPPASPPAWTPPSSWGTPSSGGPSSGSPGSPTSSSSPASPGSPGSPPTDPTRRPRFEFEFDERKDDEEPAAYGAYDVGFSNPIASGAQVLFGGFGGFGGGGFGGGGGAPQGGQGGQNDFDGVAGDLGDAQEELAKQFDETGGFGP